MKGLTISVAPTLNIWVRRILEYEVIGRQRRQRVIVPKPSQYKSRQDWMMASYMFEYAVRNALATSAGAYETGAAIPPSERLAVTKRVNSLLNMVRIVD